MASDTDSSRVLDYLMQVEVAAEDVLTTKQQIVDLDMKRNQNREALNALRHDVCNTGKVKVCFGNVFIKFPVNKTAEMIQRDQERLDKEINNLRKELKAKVNHLNDVQGKPELRGYSLTALSPEELKSINNLLKR
ncbi:unnamed protein product [Knipowitschia caucasica]|uniref:p53 and DNA damage-regulated protein 1 n=1 Tax=Knipowitschia caucasica TaxID=637954 RepID=A0AAV2M6D7_KNICA